MKNEERTTEQLLAEIKALKQKAFENELFSNSIIDSAIDAIITITEKGNITSWNKAALAMFGYESDEIINKDISQIIPDKYQQHIGVQRLIKIWLQNITGKTTEFIAKKKDGTEFPIELSVSKWESENSIQITGIIRDISERTKSYNELQKLHSALKKSQEIVFMTDVDGFFSFVNEQFTIIYGYEPQEVLGIKTPRILKNPKENRDFKSFWETLINKQSIHTKQYTNITKFGEIIDVEGSADPILDRNGNIIGFLGIQRDIRERLMHIDNLKIALAKARESDKLKSEFLSNISHEIRTPLNSIIGLSSLIDRDTSLDDIMEFNEIINSSGEHLLEIVDNLFDLSLIESNQLKVLKKETDINSVLFEIDSSMRAKQAKNKKDHLDFNLIVAPEYKNIRIKTDKNKLIKIFNCLLNNAFTFTEEGYINYGFYLFQVDEKPVLKFFVEDTGIGIHEDSQNFVFDLFRQVDGSFTRKYEGMGIGLATAKKLTDLLGGNIWVNSVLGKGSTFFFTLPIEEEICLSEKSNDLESAS